MKVAPIVCLLAWGSVFLAVWRCWVYALWLPYGWAVILFSFIVALCAGLVALAEYRMSDKPTEKKE